MNPNGIQAVDGSEADALIAQALMHLQHERLNAAIDCLESATRCAPVAQLPELQDTLCTLYVRTNQYHKLIVLMQAIGKLTPALTLGALVVERNRRQGLATSPNLPPFKSLMSTLIGFIGDLRYSFDELCVICSLLTQLDEASAALALLDALTDALPQQRSKTLLYTEELVIATLSLALDHQHKREAQALTEKLSALSPEWRIRAQRYRMLMDKTPATNLPAGSDKVADFIRNTPLARR